MGSRARCRLETTSAPQETTSHIPHIRLYCHVSVCGRANSRLGQLEATGLEFVMERQKAPRPSRIYLLVLAAGDGDAARETAVDSSSSPRDASVAHFSLRFPPRFAHNFITPPERAERELPQPQPFEAAAHCIHPIGVGAEQELHVHGQYEETGGVPWEHCGDGEGAGGRVREGGPVDGTV